MNVQGEKSLLSLCQFTAYGFKIWVTNNHFDFVKVALRVKRVGDPWIREGHCWNVHSSRQERPLRMSHNEYLWIHCLVMLVYPAPLLWAMKRDPNPRPIKLPCPSRANRCQCNPANQNSALPLIARVCCWPRHGTSFDTRLKHLSLCLFLQLFFSCCSVSAAAKTRFFSVKGNHCCSLDWSRQYLLNPRGQPSCSVELWCRFSLSQSKVDSQNMQQAHLRTLCSHP